MMAKDKSSNFNKASKRFAIFPQCRFRLATITILETLFVENVFCLPTPALDIKRFSKKKKIEILSLKNEYIVNTTRR